MFSDFGITRYIIDIFLIQTTKARAILSKMSINRLTYDSLNACQYLLRRSYNTW